MSRIETSPRRQRLPRVLLAALLIIGTAVALLLAHAYETSHSANAPLSTGVEIVHDGESAGEVSISASNNRDALPMTDPLALCLSIGLGCVTALLVVLLRLRRQPSAMVVASPSFLLWSPPLLEASWAPRITLTTLCISRV
ncbi:hypothetical protein [Agromyces sp. Marseille-Q5079]|uniref:hypothetical protein n=1 Tax=Agromyces sp. Marseille-Q5079 TaxID=3439059 RepID=UPI003D9CA3B5